MNGGGGGGEAGGKGSEELGGVCLHTTSTVRHSPPPPIPPPLPPLPSLLFFRPLLLHHTRTHICVRRTSIRFAETLFLLLFCGMSKVVWTSVSGWERGKKAGIRRGGCGGGRKEGRKEVEVGGGVVCVSCRAPTVGVLYTVWGGGERPNRKGGREAGSFQLFSTISCLFESTGVQVGNGGKEGSMEEGREKGGAM